MRSLRTWTLALVASAVWGTTARPAENEKMVCEEGAVQVILLKHKSVRDALKLSHDEARKIHEFTARQWKKAQEADKLAPQEREQKFAEMSRENEKFLDETLEPVQEKRLREITLQTVGLLWVTRPDIAGQLSLTDEQKTRARQLQKEARRETEEIIHTQSRKVRREEFRDLKMKSRERLMGLLTPDQQARWKQMIGAPFDGELPFDEAGAGQTGR